MISINNVRNTIFFLLNKNSRGYIGVDEFNSFCQLAQLDIFENLFYTYNQFINKENKRLTGTEYADIPKNIREQIDVFAEYSTQTNFVYNPTTNYWSYNGNDLYRVEGLSLVNDATGKKVDIDEVQKRELNVMKNSPMTTPTLMFPVYVKISSSFEVAPIAPSGYYAELFYIRKPKNPKWTYVMSGNNPIYNGSASDLQDLELSPSLYNTLIMKILGYCGVSLREQEIEAVASSEELKNYQKHNA